MRKPKETKSDKPRPPRGRAARAPQKHGRRARFPRDISARGWKDITLRTRRQIASDNIGIVAAGVAYYAFLAIFPALAALISIYGLVVDARIVESQLARASGYLPDQARQLIGAQLARIAGQSSGALSWGLALSILLGLWSANKGMKALFQGVNIAYNQHSGRGLIKDNALTLLFTFGGIVVAIASMALVVAFPVALGRLGLPSPIRTVLSLSRWLALALVIVFSLAVIYHVAPYRASPRWRWVSWGSILATTLWLIGSWAFSVYVANFSSYNQTYGSVAAVVILMLWFYLSSYAILLGAEINSEMERQTERDTTAGPDKPIGGRGAYNADTLGDAQ
jgi:membrane protein